MKETHFANTSYTSESGTFYKVGMLVQTFFHDKPEFNTCVIVGFSPDGWMRLCRPFAYSSNEGTTCCSAMLGMETYEISVSRFEEVCQGRLNSTATMHSNSSFIGKD